MGVSIDAHVYDLYGLQQQVERERTNNKSADVREFLLKLGSEVGAIYGAGSTYDTEVLVVVWNEYYDGYSPGSNMLNVIGRYFGISGFWSNDYDTLPGSVDEHSLWEAIGIDPEEYPDDEDYH